MKKLISKGYKVTRSINTGNYVVTSPNGFTNVFPSIRQATLYYFS